MGRYSRMSHYVVSMQLIWAVIRPYCRNSLEQSRETRGILMKPIWAVLGMYCPNPSVRNQGVKDAERGRCILTIKTGLKKYTQRGKKTNKTN